MVLQIMASVTESMLVKMLLLMVASTYCLLNMKNENKIYEKHVSFFKDMYNRHACPHMHAGVRTYTYIHTHAES